MIDWNKSAELNDCSVEWLKLRFKRFPSSAKKIIAICDKCCKGREVYFYGYRDLCLKCANNTPKHRKTLSDIGIERFSDPKVRETVRLKTVEQFANPEAREAARLKSLKQWSDPEARIEMSRIKKQYHLDNPEAGKEHGERLRNSDAHKAASKAKRGGHDIVEHHYIYEHSDLTKYTMKMTRSRHTRLHRLMQKAGIVVPHTNMKEV